MWYQRIFETGTNEPKIAIITESKPVVSTEPNFVPQVRHESNTERPSHEDGIEDTRTEDEPRQFKIVRMKCWRQDDSTGNDVDCTVAESNSSPGSPACQDSDEVFTTRFQLK